MNAITRIFELFARLNDITFIEQNHHGAAAFLRVAGNFGLDRSGQRGVNHEQAHVTRSMARIARTKL